MTKRRVVLWKPWEKNLLRKLCKKGENAAEIAEQIKRTPIAIQHKARQLNIRTGKLHSHSIRYDRRALLLDCIEKNPGIYVTRLSKLLGRHERTVRHMVKKLRHEGFIINKGGNAQNTRFEVTNLWKDNRIAENQ